MVANGMDEHHEYLETEAGAEYAFIDLFLSKNTDTPSALWVSTRLSGAWCVFFFFKVLNNLRTV